MNNPEATLGRKSLDIEALDRLMAERRSRGHLLAINKIEKGDTP
jgi:hypothetical protein